ncbi:hypothetical protein DM860_008098 [Cuscuta australis]|uniref:Uncharacterized protein n=1 Tax=Cuscuta australis TaxID=267555 RepID=A0A328D683_9ASTE|nr:hypothetical protein DM860_008098 [Cuscuta australis]
MPEPDSLATLVMVLGTLSATWVIWLFRCFLQLCAWIFRGAAHSEAGAGDVAAPADLVAGARDVTAVAGDAAVTAAGGAAVAAAGDG